MDLNHQTKVMIKLVIIHKLNNFGEGYSNNKLKNLHLLKFHQIKKIIYLVRVCQHNKTKTLES